VFWLAMMLYAHRCTVYDNLIKDEIAREIIPVRKILIPPVELKKPDEAAREAEKMVARIPAPPETVGEQPTSRAEPEAAKEAEAAKAPVHPTLEAVKKPTRSAEAEEALRRLREKWLRKNATNAS
jgi:hypothetical protein